LFDSVETIPNFASSFSFKDNEFTHTAGYHDPTANLVAAKFIKDAINGGYIPPAFGSDWQIDDYLTPALKQYWLDCADYVANYV